MKRLLLASVVLLFATPAFADVWVKGHYDADGTWHRGYWRTEANGTDEDNYSNGAMNPHKPKPQPMTPWTPNRDVGTNPFPSSSGNNSGSYNKIEVPKLGGSGNGANKCNPYDQSAENQRNC